MRKYLVLLVPCLVPCGTFAAADTAPLPRTRGDSRLEQERPLPAILERMRSRVAYTVEYTVKKTGETHTVTEPGEGTHPWLIQNTCAAVGNGDIVVTVTFKTDGRVYTLRSKGLTEDLFIARDLGLTNAFGKWHKAALAGVKASPDVKPIDHAWQTVRGEAVENPDKAALAAVEFAKAKYDEKRPELMTRFRYSPDSRSPFYRASGDLKWQVYSDGDRLYAFSAVGNRMIVANFSVEFRRYASGAWQYVGLTADEYFKGE
jgi:hypothetical protein